MLSLLFCFSLINDWNKLTRTRLLSKFSVFLLVMVICCRRGHTMFYHDLDGPSDIQLAKKKRTCLFILFHWHQMDYWNLYKEFQHMNSSVYEEIWYHNKKIDGIGSCSWLHVIPKFKPFYKVCQYSVASVAVMTLLIKDDFAHKILHQTNLDRLNIHGTSKITFKCPGNLASYHLNIRIAQIYAIQHPNCYLIILYL